MEVRCDKKFHSGSFQNKLSFIITSNEDFVKKKGNIKEGDISIEVDDDLWKSAVYDYLRRDLKMSVNYVKFTSQWENFLKKNMTAKGIYFSLRYFYEIAHGDPKKSENGIGIVPHIYNEAVTYWGERNQRDKGILEKIEAQIKASQDRVVTKIVRKEKTAGPKIKVYSFEDIENMEEDE